MLLVLGDDGWKRRVYRRSLRRGGCYGCHWVASVVLCVFCARNEAGGASVSIVMAARSGCETAVR